MGAADLADRLQNAIRVSGLAPGPFDGPITLDELAAWAGSVDVSGTPEQMRPAFERLVRGDAAGTPSTLGRPATLGVGGLLFGGADPDGDPLGEADACIVWIGGGGYVLGSPEGHERMLAFLSEATWLPVFAPRYRRAPEHVWPAQLDDALAAARAVQDAGRRLILGGISAGGHAALNAALRLARDGRPARALVLVSPNTDRTGQSTTRQANAPRDPMVDDEQDRRFAELAMGHLDDDSLPKSPLLADLSALPPTYVEIGGREVLLGDSRLLAERAAALGADVTLHVDPDGVHVMQLFAPWLPQANASLARVARFIGRFAEGTGVRMLAPAEADLVRADQSGALSGWVREDDAAESGR